MPQDDGDPAPGWRCAPRAVARLQGGDSHPRRQLAPRAAAWAPASWQLRIWPRSCSPTTRFPSLPNPNPINLALISMSMLQIQWRRGGGADLVMIWRQGLHLHISGWSDLQRGRSASSSFLYLTLEPRLRRLSSSRFLNFIAQRNLARVATDSGRALALASKTPRKAIEGFVEVEEPC